MITLLAEYLKFEVYGHYMSGLKHASSFSNTSFFSPHYNEQMKFSNVSTWESKKKLKTASQCRQKAKTLRKRCDFWIRQSYFNQNTHFIHKTDEVLLFCQVLLL